MNTRMNISLLVGLVFLSVVCSKTYHHNTSLGIIGGWQTDDNDAKYTVLIRPYIEDPVTHKKTYKRCGGSRLSEEYVLTARHCVSGKTGAHLTFGNHHTRNSNPYQISFSVGRNSFIKHKSADIALIKTPPVYRSVTIESVRLPLRRNAFDLYEGEIGIAYGWGYLNNGQPANDLMDVDLTVITNSQCDVALVALQLDETYCYEMCTSGDSPYDPKGTCGGDSGSPFMIGNVQVGLTARGPSNCTAGDPSVYIRTGHFLDWIEWQTGIRLP